MASGSWSSSSRAAANAAAAPGELWGSADAVPPPIDPKLLRTPQESARPARAEFLGLLRLLETGRLPAASAADFAAADRRLNQAYAAARRGIGDMGGTVGWSDIQRTQRAWITYRDAFLAFAALRYPRVARSSLAAALTERRTAILDDMIG